MSDTDFAQSTDAAVWAKEFCDRFIISTAEGVEQDAEGLMIGWFANAIERGRTAGESGYERVGWIDHNGVGALHPMNDWRPEFTDFVAAYVKR